MAILEDFDAEAEVAELEREWADAFARKDIPALQRLMAEGCALIIAVEGLPLQVVPRNAWLESLDAYQIEEASVEHIHVRIYECVAVASVIWRQVARLRGKDRTAQFALVDVWVRQDDGRWCIAERHSSRPEHPGAARPVFP